MASRIFPLIYQKTSIVKNIVSFLSITIELLSITHVNLFHLQIPINGSGLIEYRCHPYWNQKYCPSHEHDNTSRCCSCERLEVLIYFIISFL